MSEEKMIEKKETRLETRELICNIGLVCLSCSEPIQRLSFSSMIYECCSLLLHCS